MLNRQRLLPLRERQRLIATYDAGETPCSPEQAERQIRSLVQCFEGSHVGILQRCLGVVRAFQKSDTGSHSNLIGIFKWSIKKRPDSTIESSMRCDIKAFCLDSG